MIHVIWNRQHYVWRLVWSLTHEIIDGKLYFLETEVLTGSLSKKKKKKSTFYKCDFFVSHLWQFTDHNNVYFITKTKNDYFIWNVSNLFMTFIFPYIFLYLPCQRQKNSFCPCWNLVFNFNKKLFCPVLLSPSVLIWSTLSSNTEGPSFSALVWLTRSSSKSSKSLLKDSPHHYCLSFPQFLSFIFGEHSSS